MPHFMPRSPKARGTASPHPVLNHSHLYGGTYADTVILHR